MSKLAAIARRLGERLPRVFQDGSNAQAVLLALAQELEQLDRANRTLMRSRWYTFARGWDEAGLASENQEAAHAVRSESELGRIGALFGLLSERGEETAAFRERLHRFILLHRVGLGSAPALLGLAALVYHTEEMPEFTWNGAQASARFHARQKDGRLRLITLELEDNPTEGRAAEFKAVDTGTRLPVVNTGLSEALPRFELIAGNQPVRFPVIEHVESGVRMLFLGKLEPEERLILEQGRLPLVNGIPGRGEMLVGSGYRFDDPERSPRFGGELAYFAEFSAQQRFPRLAPGESHWRYDILTRDRLAYYVAERSDARVLLDLAQTTTDAPRIGLTVCWEEQIPGCFVLKIPADFVPAHFGNFWELTRRLVRALDYGRAAGVEARLQAIVSFREETLAPAEAWGYRAEYQGRTDQPLTDGFAPSQNRFRFAEEAAPTEGLAGFDGIYNNAYFDHATFVDEARVDDRGQFDAARFNGRTFVDVFETDEFGRYGVNRYNDARFAQEEKDS